MTILSVKSPLHSPIHNSSNSMKTPFLDSFVRICSIVCLLAFFTVEAQCQWVQTAGPEGGAVMALAVSGAHLFVGTEGGGVFRSADNGASWSAVNAGLATGSVKAFAVRGGNLFAGTGAGVFLSTDDGANWTAVNSGLTSGVFALAVSGTNLFAGTDGNGVFVSTDNGTSWTTANSGLTPNAVYALAVSGTNLFAGTSDGVFRSADNGASWSAASAGLTSMYIQAMAVTGTNIIAGTYRGGVFRSTDNGTTWSAVNAGMTNLDIRALHTAGTKLYAGTHGGGVFVSTDAGTSWTSQMTGMHHSFITAFADNGVNMFTATSGGVFVSTNDGANWIARNSGLVASAVGDVVVVMGTDLFVRTRYGVWRSPDYGESWGSAGLQDSLVWSIVASGANLVAATYSEIDFEYRGPYYSTDNGTTWTAATGLTSGANCYAKTGSHLFAGVYNGGVYRSSDDGASWTQSKTGLGSGSVFSITSDGTNLYAGTGYGANSKVNRSSDNGATWTNVTNNMNAGLVFSLSAIGTQVFAGAEQGLFVSTDMGASWTKINTGVFNVKAPFRHGSNLFAATGTGMLLSRDNGATWTDASSALESAVSSFAVIDAQLFAGTAAGVWRRPLAEFDALGIADDSQSMPISLSPNPTHGTVTVRSPERSYVQVTIVNALGERVLSLSPQNTAEFNIDLSNFPSGVYVARFVSASSSSATIIVRY